MKDVKVGLSINGEAGSSLTIIKFGKYHKEAYCLHVDNRENGQEAEIYLTVEEFKALVKAVRFIDSDWMYTTKGNHKPKEINE